ncbi:MAG: putative colanic acid biosynthesis acetyltransferase WcaF [Frankiales bacterium]|nr:putative colanic acid biosynthesis acetyltransferase WcaF [Frankiales bacterium]
MSDVPSRRLATFTGAGYDKGRPLVVQAVWFAVMNVIFMAWWCPARLRPALLRAFGATVGEGVFIRHRVRVLWPWKLTVGNDVWIGEDAWLLNLEPITLGDDVCLSQGAYLCTGSHDWRASDFRYDNAPITVEAGVWVATRATVLRGVTVGRDAVIGAQALVTRDVPAAAIVPAATKH